MRIVPNWWRCERNMPLCVPNKRAVHQSHHNRTLKACKIAFGMQIQRHVSPESHPAGGDKAIADPNAGRVCQHCIDHLHVLLPQPRQGIINLGHCLRDLLQYVDVAHISSGVLAAQTRQLIGQDGCVEGLRPAQALCKRCRPACPRAKSFGFPATYLRSDWCLAGLQGLHTASTMQDCTRVLLDKLLSGAMRGYGTALDG